MENKLNILVIIPTKMDSIRLSKKNMQLLNGKPLLEHSINYARDSKHDADIIVSSESNEVKKYVNNLNDVKFLKRPTSLCGDTEVVNVYIDVVNNKLIMTDHYNLVIGLQPDNPNRTNTLDECIRYMINNNYDDLVTVNSEFKRSGSVRIFKYDYLKLGKISKRVGCIYDNAIDIHTQEDLTYVKTIIE